MNVNGKPFLTIWLKQEDDKTLCIIDQRRLPHEFVVEELSRVEDVVTAIRDMHVRGAGLIGATAAYGMYLAAIGAAKSGDFETHILESALALKATRPTAVNLEWAVGRQLKAISSGGSGEEKIRIAKHTAIQIANEDADCCRNIGLNGLSLIEEISKAKKGDVVNILTHCNAGWLAFVDYGSALSPVYAAFDRGIRVHVWVDETRPRNQGSGLTAWELNAAGIPHTIIVDNAGGHLMQHGLVDLVITGADRVTRAGDVANKIGTYLKALAAFDNGIPFYAALPSSSFDWSIEDGIKSIPIEQRNAEEVKYVEGLSENEIKKVLISPADSRAINYGFDVTPSRLVTGLISERGICPSNREGIAKMFPDKL